MKPLGTQVYEKLVSRVSEGQAFSIIANNLAQALMEGARDRTLRGEALPNAEYNNVYGDRQASKHGRRSPVTLRDTKASMRGMQAVQQAKTGTIRGSEKLRLHNTGEAKGGKKRQIFPENVTQIPEKEMKEFINDISKLLHGQSVASNKKSTSG
jgi:hypothetical protein